MSVYIPGFVVDKVLSLNLKIKQTKQQHKKTAHSLYSIPFETHFCLPVHFVFSVQFDGSIVNLFQLVKVEDIKVVYPHTVDE